MKLQMCSVVALLAIGGSAQAQIVLPTTDVSDGALNVNVTNNSPIDLTRATTGTWSAASSGKGIYDASKWAVVFKYSSVNIAAGQTLTFKNHASRAPVVWLVNGDVTIAGTVSLTGSLQEPGPGGFRGGYAYQSSPSPEGGGFGPGGGGVGGHGSYSTPTASSYGNVQILPLIGGSGGGGFQGSYGSAGGGAILIAATGTITISGSITANAAASNSYYGSGGAIRLIANAVSGSGSLRATGINDGRIRIEANSVSSLSAVPATLGVAPDNPVKIWPDATAPTIRVVSIDSATVPTDPASNLDVTGTDVVMNKTTAVTILLEATNIATTSTVTVRITRQYGNPVTYTATFLDGGQTLSHWTVLNTIPAGFSAVQARATP